MDVTHRCHPLALISQPPLAVNCLLASLRHQLAQRSWDETWPGSISGTKALHFWDTCAKPGASGPWENLAPSDCGSRDKEPPALGDTITALGPFSILIPVQSGFSRDGEFGAGCPPKHDVSPLFFLPAAARKKCHPRHPTNSHPQLLAPIPSRSREPPCLQALFWCQLFHAITQICSFIQYKPRK